MIEALVEEGHACRTNYNDSPYDGEGGRRWPIFEQGVSMAIAALVESATVKDQLPQRFALAQKARPKVIDISGGVTQSVNHLVDPMEALERTVRRLCNTTLSQLWFETRMCPLFTGQ